MIRSVANRYYRMSRTLACRTWKGFRRIPKDSKGRGEATMGLYCLRMTRKLEVVTNELANERYTLALVTARLFFFRRLQRLLTVHSRPRGPVHHVFLDAGWGERGGEEGGRGTRRGEAIPEVDSRGRAPFDTGNERKCQIRGSRGEPRLRSKSRNDGDDDSNPSPPPFFFFLLLIIIDNRPVSRAR